MATLKELVFNIKNLMSAGRVSDDELPSYEQIAFIVNYKRAQYLRQDQKKNWFDIDTIYQDLGVLEMEEVDSAECCCFESGCTIFRTKKEIPSILRFEFRYGLKINAINKNKRFELILPERFEFINYTKYPSLTKKVYYLNNRLYTDKLAALNVRAVLSDPRDGKYFTCGESSCYTDNSEYPLPQDLVDLITKDILSTEVKVLVSTINDLINNARDDNNSSVI